MAKLPTQTIPPEEDETELANPPATPPEPEYTMDDIVKAIGGVFGKELAEAKQARESAAAQANAEVAPNPAGHPNPGSPPNETHAPVARQAPVRNATVGHPSSGL